jgi:hypothetical protein
MAATIIRLSSTARVTTFLYVNACFLITPQLLTRG